MNGIDPAELSGLLDGELSPERAAAVRAALEKDDALRAEYERLRRLDARWAAVTETATFHPRLSLEPRADRPSAAGLAGAVAALLLVRFLPKFLDATVLAGGMLFAALAAALVTLVWLDRWLAEQDPEASLDPRLAAAGPTTRRLDL